MAVSDRKLRKLKDKASAAVNKRKYKKALEYYLELEKLEPKSGSHPRRVADMYRRLDDEANEVAALSRSADKYAQAGFLVKAIAVCKMILQTDPTHTRTQELLAQFNRDRGMPTPARPSTVPPPDPSAPQAPAPATSSAPVPAPSHASTSTPTPIEVPPPDGDIELEATSHAASPPPPPPPTAKPPPIPPPRRRTFPPNGAVEDVSLRNVMPGAGPMEGEPPDSGIVEIPLELDIDLELISDDSDEAREASERLRGTPFFSALSPASLELLIEKVDFVQLAAGDTLFEQGDDGNTLFVVSEGEVEVWTEEPQRARLAQLGEGQFFGEIALCANQPRSATIQATVDTELLAISRDLIGDLVDEDPGVLKLLLRFLRDRLIDSLTKTNPLFAPFYGEERQAIASRFKLLEVEEGAVMVKQGDKAKGLFVLLSGAATVVHDHDGDQHELATLVSGDLFGEMSLLAQEPAIATVTTAAKCLVLGMPAPVFREVIMTHPQVLAFVGDLADQRRREFDAIAGKGADADAEYVDLHLDLI